MKSTIDSAGRVVLPKAIRDAANLEGGTEVEIRLAGDHVEIEPLPAQVSLAKKGDFLVAIQKNIPVAKMTAEQVEEIRRQIENQRQKSTE